MSNRFSKSEFITFTEDAIRFCDPSIDITDSTIMAEKLWYQERKEIKERSNYIYRKFIEINKKIFLNTHPTLPSNEMLTIIKNMWKQLSPNDRKLFELSVEDNMYC